MNCPHRLESVTISEIEQYVYRSLKGREHNSALTITVPSFSMNVMLSISRISFNTHFFFGLLFDLDLVFRARGIPKASCQSMRFERFGTWKFSPFGLLDVFNANIFLAKAGSYHN